MDYKRSSKDMILNKAGVYGLIELDGIAAVTSLIKE
jgi:hypothetical protein